MELFRGPYCQQGLFAGFTSLKDANCASTGVVEMASPLTRTSKEAKGKTGAQPQVANEGGALSSSADGS